MAGGREAAKRVLQQVRPVLSVNKDEARRRVLNLYKAWYRQMPLIGQLKTVENAEYSMQSFYESYDSKKSLKKVSSNHQSCHGPMFISFPKHKSLI